MLSVERWALSVVVADRGWSRVVPTRSGFAGWRTRWTYTPSGSARPLRVRRPRGPHEPHTTLNAQHSTRDCTLYLHLNAQRPTPNLNVGKDRATTRAFLFRLDAVLPSLPGHESDR